MHPKLSLAERIKAETASYDGTIGYYIQDFKGSRLVQNGNMKFEAASTIKSYILACLYEQVVKRERSLEDVLVCDQSYSINGSGLLQSLEAGMELTVKNTAVLMIIISDNTAANMLIDYLGIEEINRFIQTQGFGGTILHNPIDFEKYDRLGTTTPEDYGRFFEMLADRKLVNGWASDEMLQIFRKQHYNKMLTGSLPQYLLDSEDTGDEQLICVASKSGSMNACRCDGGIVSTPYGSYVIVLMHKEFYDPIYHGEHSATVYGSKISRLIFDQYLALEGRLTL